MTGLTLYIGRQLAIGITLLTVVLGALFSIFSFVVEADFVGEGNYETIDALFVVVMKSPALVADLAPFIAMLGTIYGVSGLVRTSEVVAMRNAGLSGTRIVLACCLTVVAFGLLVAVVETGARPLHQRASVYRMFTIALDGNPLPDTGFWVSRGDVHANIRSWGGDGPHDIEVFEFAPDRHLTTHTTAAFGEVVESDRWQLRQAQITRFAADGAAFEAHDTIDWAPIWGESTDIYDLELSSLSLTEIHRQLAAFAVGSREAAVYGFEFYRRWFLVVTATGFTVFAASFVLASGPRGGHGARLALGAFAAILLYLVQQIGTNAALLTGAPPAVIALLPGLAIGAVGFYLVRRQEKV